jgi:1-acyl-sn-glycerol-3-phosphate acyltransferase
MASAFPSAMQDAIIQPIHDFPVQTSAPGMSWHGYVHGLCRLYFSRITVRNPQNLPQEGPVLYVALHRNGAVDGFVLHGLLPRVRFLISRRLRRSAFYRLFFDGFEVVRPKDAQEGEDYRALNRRAMSNCLEHLQAGGELLIFPEGTSSLGPSHLPFQGGAAHLAARFAKTGKPLRIVPIGVRYEEPGAFRSRVEFWVGEPILADSAKPRQLRQRCNEALESVGVNVATQEEQEQLQKLAYTATLGTDHTYYGMLKRFETHTPAQLVTKLRDLEERFAGRRLAYHQGVPLFAIGARWPYALALLLCGPLLVMAALLNAPPLLATWLLGRKLGTRPNIVALSRILVGLPLILAWGATLAGLSLAAGQPWLLAAYLGFSWLGLRLTYRCRKLAVAVYNSCLHADLREPALAFHHAVVATVDHNTETGMPNHETDPITH